jgi:hypothetical protein
MANVSDGDFFAAYRSRTCRPCSERGAVGCSVDRTDAVCEAHADTALGPHRLSRPGKTSVLWQRGRIASPSIAGHGSPDPSLPPGQATLNSLVIQSAFSNPSNRTAAPMMATFHSLTFRATVRCAMALRRSLCELPHGGRVPQTSTICGHSQTHLHRRRNGLHS